MRRPIEALLVEAWGLLVADWKIYLSLLVGGMLIRLTTPLVALILSIPLVLTMTFGIPIVALQRLVEERPEFRDLFAYVKRLGPIIGMGLTIVFLMVPAFILMGFFPVSSILVLPLVVYFSISWSFVAAAIMDQKIGAWAALEASGQVVAGNWWWVLLVLTVYSFVLRILAIIPLIGGVLEVMALIFAGCLYVVIYRELGDGVYAETPTWRPRAEVE